MSERYRDLVRRARESVLGRSGVTAGGLRQAVEARVAGLGGRQPPESVVPGELATFVDKVAQQAYRVTDDDVRALQQAGYSEVAIFEITASAALGAAVGRLERGLAALKGDV